ncbi:hypothetical protein CEUSTIGMA_g3679.t1 [Chlamydomonas eustigma]|uniref:Uncharacterized protein n=1 Tax=Chlamydomonas eustigma TaxID=1157962 RepID=A0A250WZM4_9CHLO|nr:hypothetical protein CEUSTIGMA_g3679.t1 [Chlamydomonas eustigma]|eukprot:GAX76235.1 hypothetical protein CEUSTIGMA_g3679.t1 [Chlamydomonas eustigma]
MRKVGSACSARHLGSYLGQCEYRKGAHTSHAKRLRPLLTSSSVCQRQQKIGRHKQSRAEFHVPCTHSLGSQSVTSGKNDRESGPDMPLKVHSEAGYLDIASAVMVAMKALKPSQSPASLQRSSALDSNTAHQPFTVRATSIQGQDCTNLTAATDLKPVLTLQANSPQSIYNSMRALAYVQPYLDSLVASSSLAFTLPAEQDDANKGIVITQAGAQEEQLEQFLKHGGSRREVSLQFKVWRTNKVSVFSQGIFKTLRGDQGKSDSAFHVDPEAEDNDEVIAQAQGLLLLKGYTSLKISNVDSAVAASQILISLNSFMRRIDNHIAILPEFVAMQDSWSSQAAGSQQYEVNRPPSSRHSARRPSGRATRTAPSPINSSTSSAFSMNSNEGGQSGSADAEGAVRQKGNTHPSVPRSIAGSLEGSTAAGSTAVSGLQQPAAARQLSGGHLELHLLLYCPSISVASEKHGFLHVIDALDNANPMQLPPGSTMDPTTLIPASKMSSQVKEAPCSRSRSAATMERPEHLSVKEEPGSKDAGVEVWGDESLNGGNKDVEMPGEEIKRYIITSENCSLKSAANEIVKELVRKGRCLVLAEADLDISTALRVLSQAQSVMEGLRGNSTLIFKARCYPDSEDSPFFSEFPTMFAIAFDVLLCLKEQVTNHLSFNILSPCSLHACDLDTTASNYLRIAYHRHEYNDEPTLTVLGSSRAQGTNNLFNVKGSEAEREGTDHAGPRQQRNALFDDDESVGRRVSRSAAAGAASAARSQVGQKHIARRALVELWRHGVVHYAAASGPARTAAVRSMAMLTDALTLSQGIEAVSMMRSLAVKQSDGYHMSITVFTLILAKWTKSVKQKSKGSTVSTTAGHLPSLLFVDPRTVVDSTILPF